MSDDEISQDDLDRANEEITESDPTREFAVREIGEKFAYARPASSFLGMENETSEGLTFRERLIVALAGGFAASSEVPRSCIGEASIEAADDILEKLESEGSA